MAVTVAGSILGKRQLPDLLAGDSLRQRGVSWWEGQRSATTVAGVLNRLHWSSCTMLTSPSLCTQQKLTCWEVR